MARRMAEIAEPPDQAYELIFAGLVGGLALVALIAVGTCTIEATQAGDSTHLAATPVVQSFAVTKATADKYQLDRKSVV